jgi:hypothetical protein
MPDVATRKAGFEAMEQTQVYWVDTAVPATLEARNAKCKDGFYLELPLDVINNSNDSWTLITCSPKPQTEGDQWTPGVVDYGTRYTQIIKTDLSKTWTIQHNTFDYTFINRPDALMVPYRWTADGKYLYLYPRYYPGPDGFPFSAYLYTFIQDLYRINLETGDFEPVLRRDQFGALALSPDDQLLAYSEKDRPDRIHIKNMESGNDLQVKLNEGITASGAFVWNAESTKVVFTVGYAKQSDNWQDDLSGTAIYVLTPKTMHAQKVLAKDSRIFIPWFDGCVKGYWVDMDTICLDAVGDEFVGDSFFTLNIQSGHLVNVPTPTPRSTQSP